MMRWLMMAVIFISWPAWSDGPSPRPLKSTTQPQASSANPKESSNVSNQAPLKLHSAVKDAPSLDHHNVPKDESNKGNDYSSSEWWLVYLSGLLFLVTAALAIFTARLWRATVKLANDAKATSDRQDAKSQEALTLSEGQISLAARQVEILEKQHELERWQYLTTHRPKLIIRGISLHYGAKGVIAQADNRPRIEFTIANIGGSRATIIESNATFAQLDAPLPPIPPYSPITTAIVNVIREPGESGLQETLFIDAPDTASIVNGWQSKTIISAGQPPHYFFFGYVQYSDSIGTLRRIAFCRRYDASTKRFIQVDDTDYEYAD